MSSSSIPKELEEAFEKGFRQFSWVSQLPALEEPLRTYFEASQKEFQGTRFYWQTPDKAFTLVGFGKEYDIKKDISFRQIDSFILNEKEKIYQSASIDGTGAILVGAFPFNNKNTLSTNCEWGKMSNGLFYLPTFLLTQIGTKHYLTINFSAHTKLSLLEKWQQLHHKLATIMKTRKKIEPATNCIKTEEVAVEQWMDLVERTITKLNKNDSLKKVVLARKMGIASSSVLEPERILKNLQKQQINTYFFVLENNDHVFMGATPERLLKASTENFSTVSIAGSVSRETFIEKDTERANQLLKDSKNREEHMIVVHRLVTELEKMTKRNICIPELQVLKNRDIQHLFLPIEGERRTDFRFLRGVANLHPTPALGGDPRKSALQWIRIHEQLDRGLYGAPIGWIAIKKDIGEFAVGIRSAIFSKKAGFLYAGCGIVKDSQPISEREETMLKFQPMLRGIQGDQYEPIRRND